MKLSALDRIVLPGGAPRMNKSQLDHAETLLTVQWLAPR